VYAQRRSRRRSGGTAGAVIVAMLFFASMLPWPGLVPLAGLN